MCGDERWGNGADHLSEVPEERRCQSLTVAGSRCKKWALPGLPWCGKHLAVERRLVGERRAIEGEEVVPAIPETQFGSVEPWAERDRAQTPEIPGVWIDGVLVPASRVAGYRASLDGRLMTYSDWCWAVARGEIPWPPAGPVEKPCPNPNGTRLLGCPGDRARPRRQEEERAPDCARLTTALDPSSFSG